MSEEREAYGNLEDLDLMAQEYLEVKKKHEFNSWQLADLALEARNKFGDLKAFTQKTGENPGTLKVYANLAESYPTVNRLLLAPFKHHMVVMNHDRRYELLQKAVDNKWSAEKLRQEAYPPKEKPLPDPVKLITPAQIEPEIQKPEEDILQRMVGALNWYMANDKRSLELAASDALLFMCLLLGEDKRTIGFNQISGVYEIQ